MQQTLFTNNYVTWVSTENEETRKGERKKERNKIGQVTG
jgi:hypothetical protein